MVFTFETYNNNNENINNKKIEIQSVTKNAIVGGGYSEIKQSTIKTTPTQNNKISIDKLKKFVNLKLN